MGEDAKKAKKFKKEKRKCVYNGKKVCYTIYKCVTYDLILNMEVTYHGAAADVGAQKRSK